MWFSAYDDACSELTVALDATIQDINTSFALNKTVLGCAASPSPAPALSPIQQTKGAKGPGRGSGRRLAAKGNLGDTILTWTALIKVRQELEKNASRAMQAAVSEAIRMASVLFVQHGRSICPSNLYLECAAFFRLELV